MGTTSGQLEEVGCIGHGDVLGSCQTIRNGADPQREAWILIQDKGAANDAQGRGHGAEVKVGGVTKEGDSLTIFFVLLCPPADADSGDVGLLRVGDVVDGYFALEEELKVLRNEGFGRLRGPGHDLFVVGFGGLAPF